MLGHRRCGDLEGDAGREDATGRSCSGSSAATTDFPSRRCSAVLGSDYRPATDEEIRAAFGAGGGSLGPVGVDVEVVADDALREGQYVAGANRDGWHLLGVEAGRDYEPRFADIREPVEGDTCPECGGALRFQTAIEVGHIFKFGDRYSKPLEATFLDEDGTEKPLIGGSYGVGPARVMAAAVEQSSRRERDRLARVDRALRRPRPRAPRWVGGGARAGRDRYGDTRRGRAPGALRRPRRAAGGEVRGRRSHRLPRPRHRRKEVARGRLGGRSPSRRLAEDRVPASDVLKWVTQP